MLSRLDRVAYGASDAKDETGRGISKAPLTRWRDGLSEEDRRVIAALTGPAAAKLGYDLPEAGRAEAFRLLNDLPGPKMRLSQFAKLSYLELQAPFLGGGTETALQGSPESGNTGSKESGNPADSK